MSEAKKLTAKEEEWLRRASATGYGALDSEGVARLFATLDAERAKVEALERSRADGWESADIQRLAKIAAETRATAAEAEAERQKGLAADLAQALNSATSGLHGLSLQGAEAALHRYALAKEKPDAAE